jgi:hypothetical protein
MELAGPLARVLLRYAGGALVAKGGLSIDVNDPDLVNVVTMCIGAAISAGTEAWWYLARKYNWCQ